MERENLDQAINLVRNIEHLENVLEYIKNNKGWEEFGSIYEIRFTEQLYYKFPPNVQHSMMNNIIKTSIESDLERLNAKLKEL